MHLPFTLFNTGGDSVENSEDIVIQISRDGGTFEPLEATIHNLGLGCYMAHLDEEQLYCQQQAIVHISANGCQSTILEYIPDTPAEEIAEAVWSAKKRTLTSLSTGTVSTGNVYIPSTSSSSKSSNAGLKVTQIFGGK